MVESGATQVSPISGPRGGGGKARDTVASFLKFTVDTPDLKKASPHLTKRSAAAGMASSSVLAGSTYTLGAEEADELGMRIPVSVRHEVGGAASETTLPVIVVEEEGEWKIDLQATMQRVFAGAVGALGQAMATAMSGMQNILTAGLAVPGADAAPVRSKAPAPARSKPRHAAAKKKKPAPKAKARPAKKAPKKKATTKAKKKPTGKRRAARNSPRKKRR